MPFESYLKPSIEDYSMSNPSSKVTISIASPSEASSSSCSSPSELKRNNVNKFWKTLKQNLIRSYCSWWSCFKPVVVSKMKENPSTKRSNSTTTTFKLMKTTSTNATGSYNNKCDDERDQMIKEAILYCKNSMNQVSVVDFEAFEIDHSNESVSKQDSKAFVDEGIVMLSSTEEQVRAANVSAATMVISDPSAVDVSQEEEEEEEEVLEETFAQFSSLNNVELPLDGEMEELVHDTFANEEDKEPCLSQESEQLRSPSLISATATPFFLFDGTSLGTPMFAAGHDPHQSSEWIRQGTTQDDLCKEVRCIEMDESSKDRNVDSLTCLSPEVESKEGISSLTMVANGDLTYLQEPVVSSSTNTNGEFSLVRTDSAFCFHFPQYIY